MMDTVSPPTLKEIGRTCLCMHTWKGTATKKERSNPQSSLIDIVMIPVPGTEQGHQQASRCCLCPLGAERQSSANAHTIHISEGQAERVL